MWYQLCENAQAIEQLYITPPALDQVEMFEVCVQRDGPHLQLRVELPTFPDKPPARWPAGANAVQVTLDLWGMTDVELAGWGTTNAGTLTLARADDGRVRFAFVSASSRLTGSCLVARIAGFSAYTNSLR